MDVGLGGARHDLCPWHGGVLRVGDPKICKNPLLPGTWYF